MSNGNSAALDACLFSPGPARARTSPRRYLLTQHDIMFIREIFSTTARGGACRSVRGEAVRAVHAPAAAAVGLRWRSVARASASRSEARGSS